jgi:hypothetical protein
MLAFGPAPKPSALIGQMAAAATQLPHPALACSGGADGGPCDACLACPQRQPPPSQDVRPIVVGDVFAKLASRALCAECKPSFAAAFCTDEVQQVGVAVAGGLNAMVLEFEARLRQNLADRGLNIDIRNMFNELCRVIMQEKLLGSAEDLGVDLTMVCRYVDLAYNNPDMRLWFWLDGEAQGTFDGPVEHMQFADGTAKTHGVFRHLLSSCGPKQGDPLSVALAALSTMYMAKVAKRAMDAANGVPALPPHATPAQELEHWRHSSKTSTMSLYLDDGGLSSRMRALVPGYAAYAAEALKYNWQCVPKKTILTGAYYGPVLPPERWEDCIDEVGGLPSVQTQSPTTMRPPSVYLLPDVLITVAHDGLVMREEAADGCVTLGVPLGNDRYVATEALRLVHKFEPRLRGLVELARAQGPSVSRRGSNLGFQLALQGLRLSANARAAHFLRNLPRRLVVLCRDDYDFFQFLQALAVPQVRCRLRVTPPPIDAGRVMAMQDLEHEWRRLERIGIHTHELSCWTTTSVCMQYAAAPRQWPLSPGSSFIVYTYLPVHAVRA